MEYRILGPMAVLRDGRALALGGLRQRAVLAALLLAGDRTLEADQLIEQVWGEAAPPKPLSSLRSYVTNLRRILGTDDVLVKDGSGYRVDTTADVVDARDFAALVNSGRRLLAQGDAAAAESTFATALGLWRGAPLTDFRDLSFVTTEVHRLDTLRADAVECYFESALRLGRSAELVAGLESEVAANPMREKLWEKLMLAMYRAGRRSDALLTYARVTHVLDTELGVTPGVALERLATDIRNEAATLDWEASTVTTVALRSTERRLPGLFGRSSELRRLRASLSDAMNGRVRVTVVSGDSGLGKTALAQRVADIADDLGVAIAWAGHAAEVRRPPSWAWAHALRELAGQLPSGTGTGTLHAQLPDWWSVAIDDATAQGFRPTDSFDVVETTAAALAAVVSKRPALIVLDDLQRADRFTHEVLEHVASSGHRLPLLILATWQDGGADDPTAQKAFDRLRSRTDIEFIKLRGLTADATAGLIADVSRIEPTPEFTAGVHARTGGNPFFVRELVHLLADNGRIDDMRLRIDSDQVPEAVSGVIRRRMARLPDASRAALYVAAVSGTEFQVARLAEAMGSTISAATESLLPAVTAGLVVDVARQSGFLRFSHSLVRDAIAVDISGVERAAFHAAIARAYASDLGEVASQDAIDAAEHAWSAGSELDAPTALRLFDRARSDAWSRSAFREVAELDRRALDTCTRLPGGSDRFDREVDLRLQLASVEAVVNGQSSAKTLDDLRRSSHAGEGAVLSTTAVAMGCLEACGTGRYHDATVLSDSLVEFFTATADPIAGAAGYYIRALTEFMRGNLDLAQGSVATLQAQVPPVDWETYGALASFEVLAYAVAAHADGLRGHTDAATACLARGLALAAERNDAFGTAVLHASDLQLDAMRGRSGGLADRAEGVVAELSELGVDQFIGGARVIHGWSRAMGADGVDGVDTVDDMAAALALHGQGGRRIFSPLYFGLLSDAIAKHRGTAEAQSVLGQAEAIAAATGERVWDAQLSARRLRLVAQQQRTTAGERKNRPDQGG